MTPPRRRPAAPASPGPARTAPEVPVAPNPKPAPRAERKGSARLLGPEGVPRAQQARAGDAGGVSSPENETGQVDPEPRETTQSQRRPGGRYPLPVWPD